MSLSQANTKSAKTGPIPTNHKVMYVEWMDAVAHHGWADGDSGIAPARCVSIGLLVAKTKDHICLAGSWGYGDIETNNRITIPTGWIVKSKEIKL